jgi:large subunit ribosomal protein L6
MSRIGKKPISLPKGVEVTHKDGAVTVKGPKGTLSQDIKKDFEVSVEESTLTINRPSDDKEDKAMHGLYRSLLNNMVEGVSNGYTRQLELVGVGYKANVQNNVLELNLGYSHAIYLALPDEVKASAETLKGKNPTITLESIDKQLVGQIAAKIKSFRSVEPYKGKGVRFVGEHVRRKAGKTAKK